MVSKWDQIIFASKIYARFSLIPVSCKQFFWIYLKLIASLIGLYNNVSRTVKDPLILEFLGGKT